MKSESIITRLYRVVLKRLFLFLMTAFRDPKKRAEVFSALLNELSSGIHKGGSTINPTVVGELMLMRYPKELAEIKRTVLALSTAAYHEDPYLYTECTKAAIVQVFSGMGRTKAALLAWMEENPALHFHKHSASMYMIGCSCEACTKQTGTILRELHNEAGNHLARMTAELQYRVEVYEAHTEGEEEKRTLQ